MFEPVIIETRRTRLRPLQKDDASVFFEVWSDPEVAHYFSFPPMQHIFQAHQRVTEKLRSSSEGKGIIFVIESNDSGEVLGDCGLHNADWRCRLAEIGFCLARRHWGKGYMTEAAQALIDYGFREAGLRRIEANIDPRNRPSVMVVERIGFKLEGYLRERWVTGAGEVSDILLYGLIQGDRQREGA
ncbi:GNAT family N-acetyltransferase [Dyella humicola]|uniref:GNAT family N-acetyltransferase n=1 Tax=Dyella humicola TaxID=2992126 RepID=UPI00224CA536|nr:GNAT family N-acetyltransferase [Dyella humicola]